MSEELELILLREIEELKRELEKLKGEPISHVPTYQYSKINFEDLENIFDIEYSEARTAFEDWFKNSIELSEDIITFLKELLDKEGQYIEYYYEEDLKIKFISIILNKINFTLKDKKIKDFYEAKLTYKTDKFILTGTIDYVVSRGLQRAKIPYFFIQEFKKSIKNDDPRPQLLAELVSAIELNKFKSIKGAYVIGSIWNFVILEKLGENKYQYFVSENFDSTKIGDLKGIYRNLLFVKDEIIKTVENFNHG
ncbi:MAG: hypothetical protein KDK36_21600 [Leptospiraceae bacterium]|nr:hypothetical protein [Leptospiraceae bacterium]